MDAPHRAHPQVSWVSLALSLLLACTPFPKNVGDEDLEAGDDPTGGDDDDPEPLWSHVLSADSAIVRMVGMPDDGVATITLDLEAGQDRVTRYSPEGDVLWEVEVGSTWLDSITSLPDGRVIVGGARGRGPHATLWQLSPAGAIETTYSHPQPGDAESNGSVSELVVTGTGMAYVVQNRGVGAGAPISELWWANLALEPQWSWEGLEDLDDLAVLPSGEILTLEDHSYEDGTNLLRTFTPAGAPVDEQVVPRGRFADDQPLVKFDDLDDLNTRLVGVGGTSAIDMVVPGFPVAATHGHGVAVLSLFDFPSTGMKLVQLDAAGAELRTLTRLPLQEEVAAGMDVVIASDGSVYISGYETTPRTDEDPDQNNPLYGFILKLPPP